VVDLLPKIKTPLILASTSRYRSQLLSRLKISYIAVAPNVEEKPLIGENPTLLAARLAEAKARALLPRFPEHWILGADQVAVADGRIFGKAGDPEKAAEQLRHLAGRPVQFITALVLIKDERMLKALDLTTVRFRALKDAEIARYLAAEPAHDCAGSFKSEGLGITLFDEIQSRDPTGLIGLPLIALSRLLREAGYALP
jgi:septum formation protein